MRQWINLLREFSEKPSFSAAITDELLDEIITSGKWVDHGSDLEDWWDQSDEYSFSDEWVEPIRALRGKSWHEVKSLPLIRDLVRHQLTLGAEWYDDNLTITGETWVYRGLCISTDAPSFDRDKPLGRFWSTEEAQAFRFMDNQGILIEKGGTVVLMAAQLKNCPVNWRETIRSRLDQFHGDEEEIQMLVGSSIFFQGKIWNVTPSEARSPHKQFWTRTPDQVLAMDEGRI